MSLVRLQETSRERERKKKWRRKFWDDNPNERIKAASLDSVSLAHYYTVLLLLSVHCFDACGCVCVCAEDVIPLTAKCPFHSFGFFFTFGC